VRLVGSRAAWVDKYSAAGFVLPRIQLAAMGVDPRTAFPEQRFYGSHTGVVRAVAEGLADFGATYVRLGKKGEVVSGPWSLSPTLATSVRVLTTFGEIPADVIAARADLSVPVRERVIAGFARLIREPLGRDLARRVFGADDFRRPALASYELLRNVVADALEEGLLEVDEELDDDDVVASPDDTIETKMDFNEPTLPRAARPPAAQKPLPKPASPRPRKRSPSRP
jgi:ABC-type phosphate/phosphonate transport system substrate-binding protein